MDLGDLSLSWSRSDVKRLDQGVPMKFIYWSYDSATPAALGGKAMALHALRHFGWPVPAWFVLSPQAFKVSLNNADWSEVLEGRDAARFEAIRRRLSPNGQVREEIERALARLCPEGELIAVRSSGMEEDGTDRSFAGQYESFLCVDPEDAVEKVARVWRSALSERIFKYGERLPSGRRFIPPAVLVQRMVHADVAGVVFTADPSNGRTDTAVISAVYGLGSQLVNGESDADTWKLNRRGTIFARMTGEKRFQQVAARGAPRTEAVPPSRWNVPSLTDDQVRSAAVMARAAAQHFGAPQDVEWAFEKEQLYLLQARPISALAPSAGCKGQVCIWDNSNITESYSGVTTPLTFSFARRAYEGVYRQFCHLLSVPPARIRANEDTFSHMLGLIQGRIYYNLLNWYRVLALLPGFRINRRFMEQMMGVKEPLPEDLIRELEESSQAERLRDGLRLARMTVTIAARYVLLPRTIRGFRDRLNRALEISGAALEHQRAEELLGYFLELERKLLTHWDAPLLNDFFTMIFCGLLRRMVADWCADPDGKLLPDLLRSRAEMISVEPAKRIARLADLAVVSPEFVYQLQTGSLADIRLGMAQLPQFKEELGSYVRDFGDRCLGELKLESPTLEDDPLPLFRAVGRAASAPRVSGSEDRQTNDRHTDSQAELQAARHLVSHPIRRAIFQWVLAQARARTRDRENLRFERTRLFGRVRQVFTWIGERLAAAGRIKSPRDVFYLELAEVLGFLSGTAITTDLPALVATRKSEFARYCSSAPPPARLTTRGSPYPSCDGHQPGLSDGSAASAGGNSRKGIGCSPGIVRGQVAVMKDARNTALEAGAILVAEHTDPGWILLFPGARGLLVERGSLLSHSAIVARELQLPTIVGIKDATHWLRDGDWVEMDGSAGTVRRLATEPLAGDEVRYGEPGSSLKEKFSGAQLTEPVETEATGLSGHRQVACLPGSDSLAR
jgi:pyruvate,water dikinase